MSAEALHDFRSSATDFGRIAIWMQLHAGQPLTGEGIGNYTARLIGEWTRECRIDVVVHAPRWAAPAVEPYLESCGAAPGRLHVVYHGGFWLNLIERCRGARRVQTNAPLDTPRFHRCVSPPVVSARLPQPVGGSRADAALRFAALAFSFLYWRSRGLVMRFVRPVIERERAAVYAAMAADIDQSGDVDACYVPLGVWSGARLVRTKPLIVHLPDIVMIEFPELFPPSPEIDDLIGMIRELTSVADAVVSASEHVRQQHHIGFLGLPATKCHVLPHAPMALAATSACEQDAGKQARRRALADSIDAALGTAIAEASTIIYFPTQHRPYKNIAGVVRSLALARVPHPLLLLTADISDDVTLRRLIHDLGLADRVISTGRLSQVGHAALFSAVDLGITASRFEGGFPFTFAEAVSSGTRVIMARIPVTEPQIPLNLAPRMLFDTHSPQSIARAIETALADEQLLEDQRALLGRMAAHTWSQLAADYINLAESARQQRASSSLA